MNKLERWIIIILAFMALLYIGHRATEPNVINYSPPKIDTVKSIPPLQPIINNYPTTVIVQKEAAIQERKQAEKEDIITGVKVSKNEVDVFKIDTSGHKTEEVHKIEEGSGVVITNKGVEEKKRTRAGKFLRKAGKRIEQGLMIIGIIAIAYEISK